VALEWKHSIDGVDWKELSALYRAAPLGDKKPLHLQTVFSNSMCTRRSFSMPFRARSPSTDSLASCV
jgi:hypothetical protein